MSDVKKTDAKKAPSTMNVMTLVFNDCLMKKALALVKESLQDETDSKDTSGSSGKQDAETKVKWQANGQTWNETGVAPCVEALQMIYKSKSYSSQEKKEFTLHISKGANSILFQQASPQFLLTVIQFVDECSDLVLELLETFDSKEANFQYLPDNLRPVMTINYVIEAAVKRCNLKVITTMLQQGAYLDRPLVTILHRRDLPFGEKFVMIQHLHRKYFDLPVLWYSHCNNDMFSSQERITLYEFGAASEVHWTLDNINNCLRTDRFDDLEWFCDNVVVDNDYHFFLSLLAKKLTLPEKIKIVKHLGHSNPRTMSNAYVWACSAIDLDLFSHLEERKIPLTDPVVVSYCWAELFCRDSCRTREQLILRPSDEKWCAVADRLKKLTVITDEHKARLISDNYGKISAKMKEWCDTVLKGLGPLAPLNANM